jgi:uncharacterized protein
MSRPDEGIRLPDPVPDRVSMPFWTAARDNRLVLPWCETCGRPHFYPRGRCPYCGGDALAWRTAEGTASLYSWSEVHAIDLPAFRPLLPYLTAVVQLTEGPRMMTMLIGCAPDRLSADQRLRVCFVPSVSGAWQLPVFTPEARAGSQPVRLSVQ